MGASVRTDIEALAGRMLKVDEPSTTMLIATITALDSANVGRAQTDVTDDAWLPCDRDARLSPGDRVWILKQGGVMLICGRLVGPQSGTVVRKKIATESISSATAQDDDDLYMDLSPGTYRVELFAHCANTDTADGVDIRSLWANTGVMVLTGRSCLGPGQASTNILGSSTAAGSGMVRTTGHGLTTAVVYGITDDASAVIREDLLIAVATAGRLKWQWAQGTASATPTTVSGASRLYVTPVVLG